MGLYNEIWDIDLLRTSIFLPQGIYPDLLRDDMIAANGLGLYGRLELGAVGDLEYQALAGNINSDAESGIGKYTNDSLATYRAKTYGNPTNDTSYTGALRWDTPLSVLRFGYSFFDGDITVPTIFTITPAAPPPFTIYIQGSSQNDIWLQLFSAEYMNRRADNDFVVAESSTRTLYKTESYYLMAS